MYMKKILLLILLLLFSCKDEGIIPIVDDDSYIEEYYSWVEDIKHIFVSCIGCHDSHVLTEDYSSIQLLNKVQFYFQINQYL